MADGKRHSKGFAMSLNGLTYTVDQPRRKPYWWSLRSSLSSSRKTSTAGHTPPPSTSTSSGSVPPASSGFLRPLQGHRSTLRVLSTLRRPVRGRHSRTFRPHRRSVLRAMCPAHTQRLSLNLSSEERLKLWRDSASLPKPFVPPAEDLAS